MGSGFTLVSEGEVAECRASLRWYEYSADDFELTEKLNLPRDGDVKPSTGVVRVTRKSTGVTGYYRVRRAVALDQ